MFSSTYSLWKEFEAAEGKRNPKFNSNAAAELDERLRQLSFFANHALRVDRLMAESERLMAWRMQEAMKSGDLLKEFIASFEPLFELRAYVEAFYYFSFRVRCVLRRFDSLSTFECESVRNVRNFLIEHPERPDSQALVWSLSYDQSKGLVIKPNQPIKGKTEFKDMGFMANAEDFRITIERALVEALQ